MAALRDVFLTGAGAFLPGQPIGTDEMENYIGRLHGQNSVLGKRALRWNGIKNRHYALDRNGAVLHTNADMCARAVHAALGDSGRDLGDLTFLATATTQGDYLVPGHATAVHGELAGPPMEIASFQSVCASSLMAAKAAWLSVRAAEHDLAVACAGEFSSRWFRPSFYEGTALCDTKGRLCAEADMLRFTLSDGAGAIVCEPKPHSKKISLRIEYIDLVSLAGAFDPCMWAGAALQGREDLTNAWSHAGPQAAHASGSVALLQDFRLLKRVIRAWVGVYLKKVDQGRIIPGRIDWLLCHYSAKSLREEILSCLVNTAGMIPEEKWFSVLREKGNVGSASIWIMLDSLLKSGRLARGEKVLCVVPESGRAMVGFMMAEAV
jgi:3-oxoacyl-[acyl-carrier-protein] synthase-3